MQLENLLDGEDQGSEVDDDVDGRVAEEEEDRVETFRARVGPESDLPKGLERYALEQVHNLTGDRPSDGQAANDLAAQLDSRGREDAPVKGKQGKLDETGANDIKHFGREECLKTDISLNEQKQGGLDCLPCITQ